ncbi:MAG TPA: aminomethyl-transferring glycine dehydrogenase, partial [Thermoleophilaceae bacterium]
MTRYTSATDRDREEMLAKIGAASVEELFEDVPAGLRLDRPLDLPDGMAEQDVFDHLSELASRNRHADSEVTFAGAGMYDHYVPALIDSIVQRSEFLTPYTPYQPEISQGGLQVMFEFQTAISELTGLPVSNASLYEGPSSVASAGYLAKLENGRGRFVASRGVHPHSRSTLATYGRGFGTTLAETPLDDRGATDLDALAEAIDDDTAAVFLQQPNFLGTVEDLGPLTEASRRTGALVVCACDPLTLGILEPPGAFGVDVAVGEGQQLGNRLDFGGPSFGFFAAQERYIRKMPGRIAGETVDADGRRGFVLTLQTREQHIRREKATSNICTAQVLLAIMASMYGVYHGPEGLKAIARRIHALAAVLADGLRRLGCTVGREPFFDTVRVGTGERTADDVLSAAEARGINLRKLGERAVGIALDETVTAADLDDLFAVFAGRAPGFTAADLAALAAEADLDLPAPHARTSEFLTHPVFNSFHTEHEMLRYIKRLEGRDLSLATSMIPLGSCTMKLNATAEMAPITWPEFAAIHPFAPVRQTAGYRELFRTLESWLCEITGFDACSLQPNAGSQGEYSGLMVIRAYHQARGEGHRDVCLIPVSAHGTNPASAVMAGLKVVAVACDAGGNVDLPDLRAKAGQHRDRLAALMVTYPSTHGVFEAGIREICDIVHEHGGQVYLDGANMNAQVGLCRPGDYGADVCHLNLHKTFCIPHGGGGPGMGPICCAAHLAPFLPGHPVIDTGSGDGAIGPVSAAPWGSASILPISWAYIALMGAAGLTRATEIAILNAN